MNKVTFGNASIMASVDNWMKGNVVCQLLCQVFLEFDHNSYSLLMKFTFLLLSATPLFDSDVKAWW